MKPKTKLQIEIMDLKACLSEPSKAFKSWVLEMCIAHVGYVRKHDILCMMCGDTFKRPAQLGNEVKCQNCKRKLALSESLKRTLTQYLYVTTADVVGRFQVIRYWYVQVNHAAGKSAELYLSEVTQYWYNEVQKLTIVSKNCSYYGGSFTGMMSIKPLKNLWKYRIFTTKIYPKSRFTNAFEKRGLDSRITDMYLMDIIPLVFENPCVETLLKQKRYDFLSYMIQNFNSSKRFWPSVKIAMRNGYTPNNVSDWFDYLNLLTVFNKDIRNVKYVCPEDFEKEHDRYVEKHRKWKYAQDLEKKKAEIEAANLEYKQRIEKYKDLEVCDDEIVIRPLMSVEEFLEEGLQLKHCVFANNYFKKEDSLVLTARIGERPIETIEVSLKNREVVQSRGLQNKPSGYNSRILKLASEVIKML